MTHNQSIRSGEFNSHHLWASRVVLAPTPYMGGGSQDGRVHDDASSQEPVSGSVSYPHVLYLNVASLSSLRSDSHCNVDDCLHYCVPGPIDAWVEMLHRALWAVAHIDEL